MKKLFRDESGQSVVEFALVAPILILLLCGIIDFGWILSAKLATDNCAREGARYASVCSDYSLVTQKTTQRVEEIAAASIKDGITVTVSYSNPGQPQAGDVTVKVTSRVNIPTIVANTIFGGDVIILTSSVTMKAG